MNRKYLQKKWNKIETSRTGNAYRMLRLTNDPSIKLFVAINESDERAFMIYSDDVASIDRSPVKKQNITLDIKDDAVIVVLTNTIYSDIFDDLILSITAALNQDKDTKGHLSLFMVKYIEWATFFDAGTNDRLSFERLLGLYGELIVLKRTLLSTSVFSHHEKMISWRGPFGDVHDFAFEYHDLEVKSKLINTSTINISSVFQLEQDGSRPLQLSVVNLIRDDSNGVSLHNLIGSIRDILDSGTSGIEILHRALLLFDMTFETSTKYDNFRFTLDSIETFDTTLDKFPKLTTENTISGITSIRYKIDTSVLKSFIIS